MNPVATAIPAEEEFAAVTVRSWELLFQEKFPELDVTSEIGSGAGWGGAVDSLKWKKGDLMLMASTPQGPIARVFLGSTATELLPHIRVPILVHPACG